MDEDARCRWAEVVWAEVEAMGVSVSPWWRETRSSFAPRAASGAVMSRLCESEIRKRPDAIGSSWTTEKNLEVTTSCF